MIKLYSNYKFGATSPPEIPFTTFTFPGGEVSVKLTIPKSPLLEDCTIAASIRNTSDFFEVVMLNDAIRRAWPKGSIHLFMPYVPYARQDRVCNEGEAFSLKVFLGLINSLKFDMITVVDPHSDVAPALLECKDLQIQTQLDIVKLCSALQKHLIPAKIGGRTAVLVSPDAGANKKTMAIAAHYGHDRFVRADKVRDLATGKILDTIVYTEDGIRDKTVVVCDDICDGGATFIALAKACKAKGCTKFVLYVTHGIFSKGANTLFDNGIDEIHTTDSFCRRTFEIDERVNITNLI